MSRGDQYRQPLPVDMKKGMRNLPLSTLARRFCSVLPSKGRAPHTSTYSTTPRLCTQDAAAAAGRDQNTMVSHGEWCAETINNSKDTPIGIDPVGTSVGKARLQAEQRWGHGGDHPEPLH